MSSTAEPLQEGRAVHGDVLELLAEVAPETFDTIFLDWPYSQSSPVRGKDDGAAARIYGPTSFLVRLLQATHRVAKTGCHIYLFIDWKGIPDSGYAMSVSGWFPTTIISWDTRYVGTGGFWRNAWSPIWFASKGPAEKRTDKAFANSFSIAAKRQGRFHPHQKPEELWEKFCTVSVAPGNLVLDPFAGSQSSRGPTERAGGHWFGIDVDPSYADPEHPPERPFWEDEGLMDNP